MTSAHLPFMLRAQAAVDRVLASQDIAYADAFSVEGDTRSAAIALVELVFIDFDRALTETTESAIAAKLLLHLASTGLTHPQQIIRFTITNAEQLAHAFRDKPGLLQDDVVVGELLRS